MGGCELHKNVAAAIQAANLLRRKNRLDIQLLILGGKSGNVGLAQQIREFPGRFEFPGWVSAQDLPYFYHLATALVLPSLFEGFGLPVVEAFACGCPVICSDRGSLPEVAGQAAWLVDPLQPEEIAEAIYSIATDQELRRNWIEKGLQRAREFSWRTAACQTVEVYEDTARSRPASSAADHRKTTVPV